MGQELLQDHFMSYVAMSSHVFFNVKKKNSNITNIFSNKNFF